MTLIENENLLFKIVGSSLHTLVYRIDVQDEINVQVGKFLKNIKRADPSKAVQGDFFLKINKCAGQIPIHTHAWK